MSYEESTGEQTLNGGKTLLYPVLPYDFSLSIRIFSGGDLFYQASKDERFWQVLRLKGLITLACVTAKGLDDASVLEMRTRAERPLTSEEREEARSSIQRILNISLDLTPFYQYTRKDPILHHLVQRLRGLKPPKTSTIFEALVDSIIEQQISLSAAHQIRQRVIHSLGDPFFGGKSTFYAYPTPQRLARVTDEELRACGLSRNKASYITGISRAIVEGTLDLDRLSNKRNKEDIFTDLCELRGIGRWTAEFVMLRGMGRYDVLPADDLGVRRALSQYYQRGRVMTNAEARELADLWGPWKGLAGFYLIVAEREGILAFQPS